MDPLEEGLEVEPAAGGDHDLAVEDAAGRAAAPQRVEQLREVPGQGPLVAAAELDLVAVPEDDAAEPVPLGLVEHAALGRELPGELGQHGGDGGHHGQVHGRKSAVPLRLWRVRRSGSVSSREALVCIGRYGLARTTVDDVAQASGVSRATIYRHFPGGREQLVADTVAWEIGRFFQRLGEAVAGAPDLCVLLEDALVFARRALAEHVVFQRVVRDGARAAPPADHRGGEPDPADDRRLPRAVPGAGARRRPPPGRAPTSAARPTTSPGWSCRASGRRGVYDLDDPAEIRLLVREQLLAGVLAPGTILPQHP